MNDRVATITRTQAAAGFPGLARYLAESTALAPELCEQALRAAAGDYVASERRAEMKSMWKRATDSANASIGLPPENTSVVEKTTTPWGAAVAAANGRIGAV